MTPPLTGLIAASYTPMKADGSLNVGQAEAMVAHLQRTGVRGLYVCGSTGEGMSLSSSERRAIAEAYISAAKGRLRTIVQVGHNSIVEARELARHAQSIGADAFSAVPPSYYKIESVSMLVECIEAVAAAAPELPFYYYHIPLLTGTTVDIVEFVEAAAKRIPNLVGVKYTAPKVHEYQALRELMNRKLDVVWGTDEMLLSALVVGARGAIGSTYNFAAPLYRAIIDAFDRQDLEQAEQLQMRAIEMVRLMMKYPFHSAAKCILGMLGMDFGQCRPPLGSLDKVQQAQLGVELEQLGFWDWLGPDVQRKSISGAAQRDGASVDGAAIMK
jgi:N-acetylneuraminate lyase